MHIGIGYNKYSNFYFKEQQSSFMLRFMGLTGPAYLKSMLVTLSVCNSYSTFAPRSAILYGLCNHNKYLGKKQSGCFKL